MSERATSVRVEGGDVAVLPARRLFSVDEYYRMAEAGILRPDERVELLEGEIYKMAAIGSRHATRVRILDHWFTTQVGERAIVSAQCPVRLTSGTEPEPDLALLRPRPDLYDRSHPGPADVFLLVEVADTSLAYDLRRKLPLYAESGIPELWIVDLTSDRVLVHREPSGQSYAKVVALGHGDALSPLAFPDLVLPMSELLL